MHDMVTLMSRERSQWDRRELIQTLRTSSLLDLEHLRLRVDISDVQGIHHLNVVWCRVCID